MLWNADTDTAIGPMTDGMTINFTTIGTTNISVQAVTNPAMVGGVQFALNGSDLLFDSGPDFYFIQDDNDNPVNLNVFPWSPAPGNYSITATAYGSNPPAGDNGPPVTINVTITP